MKDLPKNTSEEIRQGCTVIIKHEKLPKLNISRSELTALRELESNKNIKIVKEEKGNATVLMDSEDYDKKMHEHIACGSYRKLDRDSSKKICSLVTSVIKNLKLNEEIKTKLYPKEAMVPRIYGLPKIHKNGIPLHPIVNTIGSPTYKLARFLANLLKPLVGKTSSFVKDSASWINEIGNERLNIDAILASFDVVSLYTKIPISDAIETIRSLTNNDTAKLVEV